MLAASTFHSCGVRHHCQLLTYKHATTPWLLIGGYCRLLGRVVESHPPPPIIIICSAL